MQVERVKVYDAGWDSVIISTQCWLEFNAIVFYKYIFYFLSQVEGRLWREEADVVSCQLCGGDQSISRGA